MELKISNDTRDCNAHDVHIGFDGDLGTEPIRCYYNIEDPPSRMVESS